MIKWINKQLELRIWRLAGIAYSKGQYSKALNLFQKAKEKFTDYPELGQNIAACHMALENYDNAIHIYKDLIQNSHLDKNALRQFLAECYAKNKNYTEAKSLYNYLTEFDSQDSNLWNNYAFNCLLANHRYEEAIVGFTKAISICETFAYAYNNRGYAKLMLNDLEGGLSDINESIKIDPTNSYSFKNRAKYYLKVNDIKSAKKDLQKAKNMGYTKKYGNEVEALLKQIDLQNK